MTTKPVRVACVIPAYNESKDIARVVELMPRSVTPIVVDDGSRDDTYKIAARLCPTLKHEKNRGAGAAIRTGVEFALHEGFDVACVANADLQHPPHLLPNLFIPILEKQADAVFGSRLLPESGGKMPFSRKIGNVVASKIASIKSGREFTDVLCGMRAYNKDAASCLLDCREDGFGFEAESALLLARRGFKIVEQPIPAIYSGSEGHGLGVALASCRAVLTH